MEDTRNDRLKRLDEAYKEICMHYKQLINYVIRTNQKTTCGRLLEIVQERMEKSGYHYTTAGIRRVLVQNRLYMSKEELNERQNRQNAR
nr:MAG TPA: hypothetical protein [Caudoviricetes sp.]